MPFNYAGELMFQEAEPWKDQSFVCIVFRLNGLITRGEG